ncbi:neuropeptide F receptor-like protein [Dinothrombium tinctorium]|uniref:Neuropeptide F receptor-like protein n=1 Tax=Dinothrombium tinctorium TaxID=1965070 RepID=A0A3S3RL52_9ACAR|nr:neuropeptide F receptor-like protein [Dinothrombium tinctorium]
MYNFFFSKRVLMNLDLDRIANVTLTMIIFANLPLLFIIISRRLLWVPSILLLLNLFVSNIAVAFICMPFTLISCLRKSWTLGSFMCKLVPFLQGVIVFVSAGTVSVIAIDRMVRIVFYRYTLSAKKLTGRYSLIIWLIACLLNFPIFYFQQLTVFAWISGHNIFVYDTL